MTRRAAAVAGVLAVLLTAGCTEPDEPVAGGSPDPRAPSPDTAPAMTFAEAYQKVPLDGVGGLRITWEVPQEQDVDAVLAARRSLAFNYWKSQATDWAPIVPVGRFLYTERYYRQVLADFENGPQVDDPGTGPVWFKLMGVQKIGTDRARVTFCADIGWWHDTSTENPTVRKDRAHLESFDMKNLPADDGARRWFADVFSPPIDDNEARYEALCTTWARHQP